MKRMLNVGIALCFLGALSYAETFSGKLVDATCIDKNAPSQHTATADRKTREKTAETCAPTSATTKFAVETSSGKVYKLDSAGNQKAMSEWQGGTLKADNDGDVHVSVSGSMEQDGMLKVDSLTAGKGHKE